MHWQDPGNNWDDGHNVVRGFFNLPVYKYLPFVYGDEDITCGYVVCSVDRYRCFWNCGSWHFCFQRAGDVLEVVFSDDSNWIYYWVEVGFVGWVVSTMKKKLFTLD